MRKRRVRNYRVKCFFKKNRLLLFSIIAIILFPLIIGAVYALPLPQIVAVDCGDLLSFYGTALGIFSSFVIYRQEKIKERKENLKILRPKLTVEVEKNGEQFLLKVQNYSDGPLMCVYLYDVYVGLVLEKKSEFSVCYCQNTYASIKLNASYNITMDHEIMDSDGYPKYVQICCDDHEGNMWNCCFDKRSDGQKIFYYPYFEIV